MLPDLIVTLLRTAIRLSQSRFAELGQPFDNRTDFPGWRRDHKKGDFEWWILPSYWRAIFEPDVDPVEAAQALEALGLLRRQDDGNLQVVVKVGKKPTRAYAIKGKALADWRPAPPSYGGYGQASGQLWGAPTASDSPARAPDLSNMLERGVALALQKGTEVLGMSLDPTDRQFAALLRAQTAMAGHLIGAQIRVDEARLRQKRADAIERITRLMEEEKERQRRLGY